MPIAVDHAIQYPAVSRSRPPIIGPEKDPAVVKIEIVPKVFPMLFPPTVSAKVAEPTIQMMDAESP